MTSSGEYKIATRFIQLQSELKDQLAFVAIDTEEALTTSYSTLLIKSALYKPDYHKT